MFRAAKTTKPRMKSKSFLKMDVLAKKAKKVANIANATKEYIPEQAMSTAKFTGSPDAVDSKIVGAPYEEDNSIGNPAVFSKV
jgi:hypothetical protein